MKYTFVADTFQAASFACWTLAGIAQGPWRVAAADVYVAGIQNGEGFGAGQQTGDVFVAGAQKKGEAHG